MTLIAPKAPDESNPFEVEVTEYKTLRDVVWRRIPRLAVLTGRNGSGKTQLVEAIARASGIAIPTDDRLSRMAVPRPIVARILSTPAGERLYRSSEWRPVPAGCSLEQANNLLTARPGPEAAPSWIQTLRERSVGAPLWHLQPDEFRPFLANSPSWDLAAACWLYRFIELSAKQTQRAGAAGDPPWVTANDLLRSAGVNVRLVEPPAFNLEDLQGRCILTLKASDEDGTNERSLSDLSSGELTFVELVSWFVMQGFRGRAGLILLDEPDAHLHPGLTRHLFRLLNDVVAEAWGVQVIMTTHSPTTVALAPAERVFEVRRTSPRVNSVDEDQRRY
jgi:predicted ATPase